MKRAFLFFTIVLLFYSGELLAINSDTLKIGIKGAPPFIMMKEGNPGGLSIEFWKLVNENLHYDYEFVQYSDIGSLINAVEQGEVDFSINPITVSAKRLETMDFSQPFFISQTTYVKRNESKFIAFLSSLFSWEFFSALAALLLVIGIFGLLVWLFERRSENVQFKKSPKGIADGFWWSAVTMTTVGYGDKAPVSAGGRVVGFIWMFTSIILISGLTAGIASALTVQSIESNIESLNDLEHFRTVTVEESSTNNFLDHYQVRHRTLNSLSSALEGVIDKQYDVAVYDKPILKHKIREMNLQDKLVVADEGFKTDYYSFSFPKDSELLPKINAALVEKLKSSDWEQVKESVE